MTGLDKRRTQKRSIRNKNLSRLVSLVRGSTFEGSGLPAVLRLTEELSCTVRRRGGAFKLGREDLLNEGSLGLSVGSLFMCMHQSQVLFERSIRLHEFSVLTQGVAEPQML